jgi:hypothetical protein
MKSVNTKGLMLGMLAIGGLIAGGAMFTGQAYATVMNGGVSINVNPVNAASAENSDDDVVVQSNDAKVEQKGETECKAEVEDNDFAQVGDNDNTAANGCSVSQSSTIGQANTNTDNDVQVAEATACQALAGFIGANICDNIISVDDGEICPTCGFRID